MSEKTSKLKKLLSPENTFIVAIVGLIIIGIYDIILAVWGQAESTISKMTIRKGMMFPFLHYAIGVLAGHLSNHTFEGNTTPKLIAFIFITLLYLSFSILCLYYPDNKIIYFIRTKPYVSLTVGLVVGLFLANQRIQSL